MEFATSSLPDPDGPVIKTDTLVDDKRPMALKTSCIAGALPIISGVGSELVSCFSWFSLAWTIALLTTETTSSTSKGFARYSKAPFSKLLTVVSKSE